MKTEFVLLLMIMPFLACAKKPMVVEETRYAMDVISMRGKMYYAGDKIKFLGFTDKSGATYRLVGDKVRHLAEFVGTSKRGIPVEVKGFVVDGTEKREFTDFNVMGYRW